MEVLDRIDAPPLPSLAAEPPRIRRAAAPTGLTEEEVVRRRAAGLGNRPPPPSTRSYGEIIRENVFTFINNVLFALAAALALVGRPFDGLVSLGVIGTNIVVGVVQEVRAKRVLDAIALLERPRARVVRGGVERVVPPEELVLGDVIALAPGDQVILDGRLVAGEVEVDESLLTGESDTVRRAPGDAVCSATYCLSGGGHYEVTAVAGESLANRIVATGKRFRRVLTPLQREVHLTVRVVLAIVIYLQVVLILDAIFERVDVPEAVGWATIVAGLVPNGLFVAIAITYAAAAVRIARMGAVVQQANAIESLSHVDTLCLDKTGTLTANRLEVESVEPWPRGGDEAALRRCVGRIVASAALRNRTAEAILVACPAEARPTIADVPFSSERRWSGVAFGPAPGEAGETLVLGAPAVLRPVLAVANDAAADLDARVRDLATRGRRVLLVARHPDPGVLGTDREPPLPDALQPLGLVVLRDVLRDGLTETLDRFERAGVRLRVISGDDPETVAALVRQAGMRVEGDGLVSGLDLEALEGAEFAAAVDRASIFGRITPTLKERIVDALRAAGRYVAMIGDGVNDVLSLKRADLAVAMGSGSQATRGVADLVLLDDSFSSLVRAVEEGHRILNGMQAVLELFLTRIATLGIVIMSSLVVEYFPIELRNASAITLFTVGIPSVLLALWAGVRPRPSQSLGRTLVRFTAPAAVVSSLAGLIVFYGALFLADTAGGVRPAADDVAAAQSALTAFLVVSGIVLVLFAAPPNRWFAVVEPPTGDVRPVWLALGLFAGFAAMLIVPAGRTLFDLAPLEPATVALVAGVLVAWFVVLRATWKHHLLERLLGVTPART